MKIYFLNYSDDRFNYKKRAFRQKQIALNESARRHHIEHIVAWTWEDMAATDFYRKNKAYLDKNRYHNGAVFKPYIILDLLERMDAGDVVFYHDCGPHPITRSIQPLVDLCLNNNGTVFHQWGDRNRNWTKRDAFVYMDCDTPQYHNAVALQNTWLLLQKSDLSLQFTREWLKYNLDERIASYVMPDTCGLPPLRGFLENRGDQSIVSNLAVKYGIKTFFGQGEARNRDVNEFMRAMPKNAFYKAAWAYVRLKRKLKRRYKLATTGRDELCGVIPAEMRNFCYLTAETQAPDRPAAGSPS
jgi:hypothetical protein